MKCPNCQKKYRTEGKKETVSELIDQPSTGINYRILWCPKCRKPRMWYRTDGKDNSVNAIDKSGLSIHKQQELFGGVSWTTKRNV